MKRFPLAILIVLGSIAGPAWAEGASSTSTSAAEDMAAEAKKKVERGVKAAAKGAERGIAAAKTGIERGAKTTARGAQRGAAAAATGVERAAKATARAADTVAKKVSAPPASETAK